MVYITYYIIVYTNDIPKISQWNFVCDFVNKCAYNDNNNYNTLITLYALAVFSLKYLQIKSFDYVKQRRSRKRRRSEPSAGMSSMFGSSRNRLCIYKNPQKLSIGNFREPAGISHAKVLTIRVLSSAHYGIREFNNTFCILYLRYIRRIDFANS